MIIPAETQKMMRLLSQVILADGHIYDTEIDALAQGAMALGLTDQSSVLLSADDIGRWFKGYLQELNETSSTEPKDVTLTRLILSLSDWPDKEAVVSTLENISLADAEFHREEKFLLSIVKTYWQFDGLDAPGSTIDV